MNYYIGLVPFTSEPYLQHFGIKGMKWGIRRYQNADGTLTPEGIKRYRDLIDEGKQKSPFRLDQHRQEAIRKAGVKISSGDTDVMAKGSKINRFSSKDEATDERIKYASITDDDQDSYRNQVTEGVLGDAYGNTYQLTYEAKRDLKIANTNAIMGYMVDKYGSMTLKEASKQAGRWSGMLDKMINTKELKNMKVRDIEELRKTVGQESDDTASNAMMYLRDKKGFKGSIDEKFLKQVEHTRNVGENVIRYLFSSDVMDKKESSEIVKEMKKRGYDAMVDVEDLFGGYIDYPIVLLNPKDSVKKVKSEKLNDWRD